MKNRCEVEQNGICQHDAIGILVWKHSEMVLAVCQEHADNVTSNRVELKRFDAAVA